MNNPAAIAQMLIRATGVLLLILGIILWTGKADSLRSLHTLLGIILVLSLWTLAYLALRCGVAQSLATVALVWGLIAPILGISQEHLLTGNAHWLIQVAHLLVGLVAIGLGEMLGKQLKGEKRLTAPARR